jgi:hypothetical protein
MQRCVQRSDARAASMPRTALPNFSWRTTRPADAHSAGCRRGSCKRASAVRQPHAAAHQQQQGQGCTARVQVQQPAAILAYSTQPAAAVLAHQPATAAAPTTPCKHTACAHAATLQAHSTRSATSQPCFQSAAAHRHSSQAAPGRNSHAAPRATQRRVRSQHATHSPSKPVMADHSASRGPLSWLLDRSLHACKRGAPAARSRTSAAAAGAYACHLRPHTTAQAQRCRTSMHPQGQRCTARLR